MIRIYHNHKLQTTLWHREEEPLNHHMTQLIAILEWTRTFAGMTLDKCIVLRIGTLTGCPLCRESHPLCRLKNPTVISIWLLVGFHPATRSVQSTPADNTRKSVWQYIEKERKYLAIPLKNYSSCTK